MKKRMNKRPVRSVSRQSVIVLFAGTVIVLLQLGYIAFDALCGDHANRLYTLELYRKCLDSIMLEVILVVIGAFLFDMTVRECVGVE